MVIRFVQVRVHDPHARSLVLAYEKTVIPALKATEGCLAASLLQNNKDPYECVSMTLWRSATDAQNYERSGHFASLVEAMRPYFAESTEWKIQLGSDLTVQYEPIRTEPAVQKYNVDIKNGASVAELQAPPYIRIVSHRIRPGAAGEFRQIYERDVVPVLRERTGCRNAYLVADPVDQTKMLSVTVWDSRLDADKYESHGEFSTLLAKLQPTLTDLSQWKLEVGHPSASHVATSDDVTIEGFELLVGGHFH
ncbi:MAG: hypothetical protein A2X67_10740 [Ignavibacteria bacterium GWA2_55_11]|nr:MAG: hypothetical protein A2X67_10740 [Ignavibacteria bacterium GWA2_55_11]OGU47461.1 MAG: hypothetical protein A2X68_09570 [Ignavibacteria bacterium GWC2_56_12]OGU71618.1 MAG: hypothetical protein A3H45_05505 [Ignavibacteria bacterium RIFCSPLOWO2_02_FULL_55_14]OGU74477.1 MAG: hypothetical protein A3G43_07015 [Ignavibacteria bacterium RIFCSPLOWO2_12_FULL_56_21]